MYLLLTTNDRQPWVHLHPQVGERVEHDGAAHDGGPVLGHHGRVQLLAVQQLQCTGEHDVKTKQAAWMQKEAKSKS